MWVSVSLEMYCVLQKERSNLQRGCTEKVLAASGLALGTGKAGNFPGQQTFTMAIWPCTYSPLSVCKTQDLVWWRSCFCCPAQRWWSWAYHHSWCSRSSWCCSRFLCFLRSWLFRPLFPCFPVSIRKEINLNSVFHNVMTMLLVVLYFFFSKLSQRPQYNTGAMRIPWQTEIVINAFLFPEVGAIIFSPQSSSLPSKIWALFSIVNFLSKTERILWYSYGLVW